VPHTGTNFTTFLHACQERTCIQKDEIEPHSILLTLCFAAAIAWGRSQFSITEMFR
jgi:hypothetical protein